MTIDSVLDQWHMASELSVVDAALLQAGYNPSEHCGLRGISRFGRFDPSGWDEPQGYDAAFTALKSAVLGGKLRALFTYSPAQTRTDGGSRRIA